jgi:signal transduction histidine kinase
MAQALELQRRFVADAGHELRTPLTLLSTRTQLLARRVRSRAAPLNESEQLITRDADGIVADTAALTAILEELLMAADVRTPVAQEPVDLATLVASAVESAQAEAQQAGVTLTVDVNRTHPTVVAGAPTALARSVAALVDNALDHATSQVGVSVGGEGRTVVVEVVDDGPGISEETLPRMFDRFSSDRRHADRTGERRHFGLGLALVSEIATRHGGTVTAANRLPPQTGALLRLAVPGISAPEYLRPTGPIG